MDFDHSTVREQFWSSEPDLETAGRDEMTILFILITDNFPYKSDRLLKLEFHFEILKTVPN